MSRTAERHLLEADSAFDASPAGRLRALDLYAEFSPWIDPATPEGSDRLARVLSHPRPLDPRFRPVVALAADIAPDEAVRIGAMLAAVRWSIASDEYACADAAVRRIIGATRSRAGGVPLRAYAALCDVLTGQGRESEALAVARHLDEDLDARDGPEDRMWRARCRCAALAHVEAWDETLSAVAACEALWSTGPTGCVVAADLAVVAARALLGRGEPSAARHRLDSVDLSRLEPTEAPRFLCIVRALEADVELADGRPDAALSLARAVMHDGGASPGTWCGALTTALEVSDRTGRTAEVNEIVATLTDLLSRPGDRIGVGVSLRLFARAFTVLERTPVEPAVVVAAGQAALDDLLLRISELAVHARRDSGLSALPAAEQRILASFRRRHAAALAPLHRALAPDLTGARGDAHRRLAEAIGGLDGWRTCDSCLVLWNGQDEPLPIGHLLGPGLRATLLAELCPGCSRTADATARP